MQKNEIEEIVKAISAVTNKSGSGNVLDMVIKFISTASFALVMWVLSTVNAMQTEMVKLSTDATYMRSSLQKMETFTDKPRFTQEHYDAQTMPLINAMGMLTDALASIEKRMNSNDLDRQKMLIAIQALEMKK